MRNKRDRRDEKKKQMRCTQEKEIILHCIFSCLWGKPEMLFLQCFDQDYRNSYETFFFKYKCVFIRNLRKKNKNISFSRGYRKNAHESVLNIIGFLE